MSNEWHYLSDEERDEERKDVHQSAPVEFIDSIKNAFRPFTSPFVSGDRSPNRANCEQQRELNDIETRH